MAQGQGIPGRCADLTTEEARTVVDALGYLGEPLFSLSYIGLSFEPYLPHFEVYCQHCG